MNIFYFDKNGNYSGNGESATLPPTGATEQEPVSFPAVWDGEKWFYPVIEPLPVSVVSMRQARLALLSAGKLAEIETAIEAMPAGQQKEAVRIEWEYAAVLERDSITTQTIGAAVGMTAEQMQDLFTAAAGL